MQQLKTGAEWSDRFSRKLCSEMRRWGNPKAGESVLFSELQRLCRLYLVYPPRRLSGELGPVGSGFCPADRGSSLWAAPSLAGLQQALGLEEPAETICVLHPADGWWPVRVLEPPLCCSVLPVVCFLLFFLGCSDKPPAVLHRAHKPWLILPRIHLGLEKQTQNEPFLSYNLVFVYSSLLLRNSQIIFETNSWFWPFNLKLSSVNF